MTSYNVQRGAAIAVAVILGILGAVQFGNADLLGITPGIGAWLGVLSAALGIVSGFLPKVTGRSTDPDDLTERVWQLSEDDRRRVARTLANRATEEEASLMTRPPTWLPTARTPGGRG